MHKITQVRLKNFQSHEDTTISFDDYNIIYGKTNSGKSAILRGIKWALYNLPPAEGVDFRRFGTKETIVEVTFDDGKKIRRRRTSKENEYILDNNGEKQTFTQFGRGPLKEVLDFHGMYQVNLFGTPQSINIVEQSEPPFFLSNGPTARGKLIGRLAGTVLYESALSIAKKDANSLSKSIEHSTKELEDTQEIIKSLGYIDQLKEFLDFAKTASAEIEKDKTNLDNAQVKSKAIENSFLTRQVNTKLAEYKDSAVSASEVFDSILNTDVRLTQIENYKNAMISHFETWVVKKQMPYSIDELDDITNNLSRVMDVTASLASIGIKISEVENKFKIMIKQDKMIEAKLAYLDKINNISESVINDESKIAQINQILAKITSGRNEICQCEDRIILINKDIEKKQSEYKDALLSAGVCPTCKQSIDKTVTSNLNI